MLLSSDRKLLAVFTWKKRGSVDPTLHLRWALLQHSDLGAPGPGRLAPTGKLTGLRSGFRVGIAIDNVLRANLTATWALLCEDAYLGRSPKVTIQLARWAGQMTGPLEDGSLRAPVRWVRADDWRAEAFGIRRGVKRELAKAATIERLPEDLRVEAQAAADRLDGFEHVSDALGIALWGLGLRVETPSRARAPRRGKKPLAG